MRISDVSSDVVSSDLARSGALSVGSLAGGSLLEGVVAHISAKQLVVVLDDASANDAFAEVVSTLVERCPALTVVVTSQLPLRLRPERVLALDPLALPSEAGSDPDDWMASPSVDLYRSRAEAGDPLFVLAASTRSPKRRAAK